MPSENQLDNKERDDRQELRPYHRVGSTERQQHNSGHLHHQHFTGRLLKTQRLQELQQIEGVSDRRAASDVHAQHRHIQHHPKGCEHGDVLQHPGLRLQERVRKEEH